MFIHYIILYFIHHMRPREAIYSFINTYMIFNENIQINTENLPTHAGLV